ncbi:MAG: hypothetical protein FJ272_17695, partial [Planctomycetes bacterium]|nr:hypothetical protein [Planctomycetota bacterium]
MWRSHLPMMLAVSTSAALGLVWMAASFSQRCLAADDAQPALALDLKGCPEGAALEWTDIREDRQFCGPPNPEVDKFFKGWTAALSGWMGTASCLKVIKEGGESVLTNVPYGKAGLQARTLVGGRMIWADYTVKAVVRLASQEPSSAYGEHTSLPFVGVFARYQDLNRFYLFALRPGGATLWRRTNSVWTPLASAGFTVASDRFYELALTAKGNDLVGSVDGKQVLAARDGEYAVGKVGVRFNTDIRLKSIQVTMGKAARDSAAQREAQQDAELAQVRKRYAKPVVWKTLDLSGLGGFSCYPAHLRSADTWDLVLTCSRGKTMAVDLGGKTLWEAPGFLDKVALGAPDAAGVSRIVGVSGQKIVMLDGRTGKQIAQGALSPPPGKQFLYGPWRLGNLTGKGQVNYVVRFGDNTPDLIVYDENLKELFRRTVSIEMGHTFGLGFWDVDG